MLKRSSTPNNRLCRAKIFQTVCYNTHGLVRRRLSSCRLQPCSCCLLVDVANHFAGQPFLLQLGCKRVMDSTWIQIRF